jgi:D-alanine-D-alanine ligase
MSGAGRLRVAVLFGGRSVEHEVSIRSARTVIDGLDPARFEAIPVGVTHDGRWRVGEAAARMLRGEPDPEGGAGDRVLVPDPAFRGLAGPSPEGGWRGLPVDVVFPLIHGIHGEDGTLQGLLDLAEVPYVGSGVVGSALGMDKGLQRRIFRDVGLPVLPALRVERRLWERNRDAQRRRVLEGVPLPCFVKPNGSGSSVGVSKVKAAAQLDAAVDEAALYDQVVLVEPAVDAREIECAVLGNEEPLASGPGEVVPSREFYDYRAKYLDEGSRLLVPAPVDEACAAEVRRMSREAFRALGCSGLARVDFFLERGGARLWLNEINTLPGFTSISMYPRLWAHEGIGLRDLIGRLVDLARERHADRSRNRKRLPG